MDSLLLATSSRVIAPPTRDNQTNHRLALQNAKEIRTLIYKTFCFMYLPIIMVKSVKKQYLHNCIKQQILSFVKQHQLLFFSHLDGHPGVLFTYSLIQKAYILLISYNTFLLHNSCQMPKQVIIPLKDGYPFGTYQDKIGTDDHILVEEIFQAASKQQIQDIKTICTIRRAFAHPNLINIKNFYSQQYLVKALYQYVHLSTQPNYFQLDQSLEGRFRKQLFSVVDTLKEATIKFTFQPKNLGIGANKECKYFLDIFQIGQLDLEEHYKQQKQKIEKYLKKITNQKSSDSSQNSPKLKRLGDKQILSSVSTSHSSQYQIRQKKKVQSSQLISSRSGLNGGDQSRKSLQLIELINQSKKKSLEALKMYRKIKHKEQ